MGIACFFVKRSIAADWVRAKGQSRLISLSACFDAAHLASK